MKNNKDTTEDNSGEKVRHEPTVSIIIPAGRKNNVSQHLKSVLLQNYPKDKFEVIIVSHHPFDPRPDVRFVKTKQIYYPGKMRNIGASHAKGECLLFLDDDCEPLPNWINANVSLLKNKDIGAVSGIVCSGENTLMHKVYDFSSFDLCQSNTPCQRVLCTATFGVRRAVFESVGGFDETLRVVEDIDLCLRLNKKSLITLYHPDIKVIHYHDRVSFLGIIRSMFFWGYHANVILIDRYPSHSFSSRIMRRFRHPAYYLIFSLPRAIMNTIFCCKRNFREYRIIALLLPFIFIAKLSYHLGVVSAPWEKNDS